MASPTPLPVIVTHLPATDMWPNLLQGLVGAVIAAIAAGVVSFFVARYVVHQTKKLDIKQARELAALAAAEELGVACLDAVETMERHFRSGGHLAARDAWSRAVARKSASLHGFIDTAPLEAFVWELDRHVVLATDLERRWDELQLDEQSLQIQGEAELDDEWRDSWRRVVEEGAVIERTLIAFREEGR